MFELREELKPHQKISAQFMHENPRCINGDKPGIGKTFPTLNATLTEKRNENILISCGKSAMSVWPAEIEKWYPEHLHRLRVVKGDPATRLAIWNKASDGLIWLCSLNALTTDLKVMPGPWDCTILDEAHKFKSRKSKLLKYVKCIRSTSLYMLTGTPTSRHLSELWTYLNLIDSRKFSSYWKWVNTFFYQDIGDWGDRKLGPVKDEKAFQKMLAPYFIRRDKVEGMPPLVETEFPVEMTIGQKKLYRQISEDMLAETSPDQWLIASTVMAKIVRLRQLLVCPKLLDPNIPEYGAAIHAIADYIEDNEISHTVIFCPFKAAFPYLSAFLWDRLGIAAHQLVGGMDGDIVSRTIKDWERQDSGIIFLSIQFAQSFSLIHSQNGFFLGYDYDPNNNEQARYRMLRLNSSAGAFIRGVSHGKNTADEDTMGIITGKLSMTEAINRMPVKLRAFLEPQNK